MTSPHKYRRISNSYLLTILLKWPLTHQIIIFLLIVHILIHVRHLDQPRALTTPPRPPGQVRVTTSYQSPANLAGYQCSGNEEIQRVSKMPVIKILHVCSVSSEDPVRRIIENLKCRFLGCSTDTIPQFLQMDKLPPPPPQNCRGICLYIAYKTASIKLGRVHEPKGVDIQKLPQEWGRFLSTWDARGVHVSEILAFNNPEPSS